MMEQPPRDLVVDVGNTRMKLGLFADGRLAAWREAGHGDAGAVQVFLGQAVPRRIAVGSVAGSLPAFMAQLRQLGPVHEIAGDHPSPVRSLYTTPGTLGVDRLANACGAALTFPGRAVLAIDLGTCATYDLVDELAVHRGGIISPGLRMRGRAMHAYSARLPEVLPADNTPVAGTDTRTSLAAGIFHGLLMEVQGFIAHFRREHPALAVVITGGDAPRIVQALKSGIFAHPTLTLIGLHALLHYDPDRAAPSRP